MIIRSSEASHWYDAQGRARHSVPNKSKPGTMRNTTLRDARKENLRPSVTNVLGSVLANKQLQDWKMTQVLMAALTLPRLDNETLDDFAARAVKDAQEHVENAANFGTTLHRYIESYLVSGASMADAECQPYMDRVIEWMTNNVEECLYAEGTVVGNGYAGTVDFVGRIKGRGLGILDFKTRKRSKWSGKIEAYEKDCSQLAAYRDAMPELDIQFVANLLINSEAPETPVLHVWGEDERIRCGKIFNHALDIWCLQRNYDPRES